MSAEEFDKKLEMMLTDDLLMVSEIMENVKQMREAYADQEKEGFAEKYCKYKIGHKDADCIYSGVCCKLKQ